MRASALLLLTALAGCGPHPDDSEPSKAPPKVDAAVAAALADPLMSDPALTDASGAHLARSAATPEGAPVPLDLPGSPDLGAIVPGRPRPTLGLVAGAAIGARPGCATIGYSATWAARLPAPFTLPNDAAVIEAAGEDRPNCRLRVVRYVSPQSPSALVEALARVSRSERLAVRARTDTRLVAGDAGGHALAAISVRPVRGGTEADLVLLLPDTLPR